jgi:outer membrane protein insertion porin family
MKRHIYSILLCLLLFYNDVYAQIINDIELVNNNRISKETVITYGDIKLNQDYNLDKINEVLKNLYKTDFFEDIKIEIVSNKLIITVKENKLIQNISIDGIKSSSLESEIIKNLYSKSKSPFLENKVKEDTNRILNSLNNSGFYFAKITPKIIENENETVNLTFEIDLGDKAKITKIEFIGDKKIKDRTLRNIIISEESKFWKFISNKIYLNQNTIERDQRLLRNFYLNNGYYDAEITSSTATFYDDNSFKLVFKIDAGEKYTVNTTKLTIPDDYDPLNFRDVQIALEKLNNEDYSFTKISNVVEEIDKVSLTREYDFINAEVIEKKVGDNQIDIEFVVAESEKSYVERINILGNNVTYEDVIRKSLEIDEGDPFNELLHAKSINNLRSLGIFKTVNTEINDGNDNSTKIIDITVEEKPTGEITLGAGYGSEGGTIGFSVSENNFLGKNIKLTTSLRTSDTTIRGGFSIINPDFNYSNKALIANIESTNIDKLSSNGYKTTKTGFSLGTSYEQFQDVNFSSSFSTYIDDLETSTLASQALQKQTGSYFENKINYSFDFDKRNQTYQTYDGTRLIFSQGLPIYSEEYSLMNSISADKWFKFPNESIANIGFYGKMINSMNNKDVRISDRISLPRNKLKGFKFDSVGPVDNNDFVGGNYASSINIDTTLPMLFPSLENIDFKYFLDFGNVWGVDYSDTIDDSNKIRSSTGFTVDWFTPIGPLNFSLAQNLSKATTDKTESFQFNLGTTF